MAGAWRGLAGHVLLPLRELNAVVQQIASGERGIRAQPRHRDEIGALADGFNRMLDGLVSSQRALADSERRWVLALDGAGLGVWDWNAQTNKVFFSRHWKAMLGYTDKDVGNTLERWFELIHPDDLARCQADRERHFRGETASYRNEHRVRAKDGGWRWVFDQGMVFERGPAGEPLRVVGTYTDVTERKHAEQALIEKQNALSEAQRIARIGSWSWHLATDLVTTSEETCRLCDLAPEQTVHSRDILFGRLHADDRAAVRAWAQACASGQRVPDREFRLALADGQTRVLHGRAHLQRGGDGQPLAVLGTVQDITERKALEQELDQHRNHLEGLVQSRTVELEAARAEAERLARVKSEFLANMSHEIRTPLNAVLGLARIGARDSAGREVQRTFGRIHEAGEHLLGVINDVLDFSKLEAGRVVVERRPLALAAVVDNVHSLVAERATAKGLRFGVQLAPGLPAWVGGDEQRLRQILVNLLGNALKFTDRGEVHLRVTRRGDDTLFEVSDTGIGMTDEQVSRLFRSFEQADNSTTRRYGGSGLGLAISQNLAHQMDGEIVVTSTSGAGSTFTLRVPLPACEAPARAVETEAGQQQRRLQGLRLLAAEDVEINRLVLEDLLTGEGAQVLFAENGQQALDHLRAHGADAFDAVLMDIQMPVMDGYQATRALLQLAPELPVIGLTAHALNEERERCLAVGMVEHVTKPVDVDVLVTAIRRHVGRTVADVAPRRAVSGGDVTAPIDWAALLARYNGRQEFVNKLAATALAGHRETPTRLRAAAEAGNLADIAFLAHALKGLSGNLLARGVEALARKTEAAARGKEPQALDLVLELAEQMQALLLQLETRLSGDVGAASSLPAAGA
jgi:PAS domain S-box-containing protein